MFYYTVVLVKSLVVTMHNYLKLRAGHSTAIPGQDRGGTEVEESSCELTYVYNRNISATKSAFTPLGLISNLSFSVAFGIRPDPGPSSLAISLDPKPFLFL